MSFYWSSILLLLQLAATEVIDTCAIQHPRGSAINLLVQYQHDLIRQLAVDPNYTIMVVKMEEENPSDTKKVVFQVTGSDFKMYYLGVEFALKDGKVHYDTVIQSPKIEVVQSVLGFKKYDKSIICKDFKEEVRKEFEALWTKLSHQLKEPKIEETKNSHGHLPSAQSTHSDDKAKTNNNQPPQSTASATLPVEPDSNSHNKTESVSPPQRNETVVKLIESPSLNISSAPPALNNTIQADVVNITQSLSAPSNSKANNSHAHHGWRASEGFHFVKSGAKKFETENENPLAKSMNETITSRIELSTDNSNGKNKTQIVQFLTKTFGPLMDFENVINKTTETSVSFSESKQSESKTGNSSSVIKTPENFKSAASEHGFNQIKSLFHNSGDNKNLFTGFKDKGFSGVSEFSNNFGEKTKSGGFSSFPAFESARTMSIQPYNRHSSKKAKPEHESSSSYSNKKRRKNRHRINDTSRRSHKNRTEHEHHHNHNAQVPHTHSHISSHPFHHSK